MILRLAAYLTGTWKMRDNPRPLFIFPSSTTRPELPNPCASSSCKVLAAAASNPWTSLPLNTLGPENVFVDRIYMALVGFQGKFGGVRNMWPSGGLTPKVLTVMPHVLVYFQIFTLRPEHALRADVYQLGSRSRRSLLQLLPDSCHFCLFQLVINYSDLAKGNCALFQR